MNHVSPFNDAPVIFSYTRAQAIEDGVLIDLTDWARETGFRIPVACTAAVWHQYIVPPRGIKELGQSQRGRAHDLLWMLHCGIRAQRGNTPDEGRLLFKVIFRQSPTRSETPILKAICSPGDNGEPVLTVMLLNED